MSKEDKGAETRETFTEEIKKRTHGKSGPATAEAEQKAKKTGKLHPLVDPAGYGVIRRSLPRFIQRDDGLWEMAVGTPMPKEDRLDTTTSMHDSTDVAIQVLPDSYGLCLSVLPGYDLQMATGVFGDIQDPIVLCRPQFEMTAAKIVESLTLMVPLRDGGDIPEDPHYGIFGAAYLTDTYISKIGLKGYDFTITDAPARHRLDEKQLIRIYGTEVFKKAAENGHQIVASDLPSTTEVVQDLLKRAHAFVLQVYNRSDTTEFWTEVFGRERVIVLPSTQMLPQVQAAVIGLTEGTLDLLQVTDFLRENNISKEDAKRITRSVAGIPIGLQAALPNFSKRPKKGDLFRSKTDIWPIDPSEIDVRAEADGEGSKPEEGVEWL
jgi:hypothetical protein